MGQRRLPSTFLVAKDASGKLQGCIGVEIALVDRDEEKIIPKKQGEAKLKNAIGALGPKQRRALKGAQPAELVSELLPDNMDVAPVLANLAVDTTLRRQGLAQALCNEVEATVRNWGYDEVLLEVERQNGPACGLYQKLGYAELWGDQEESVMKCNDGEAELVWTTVETFTMQKSL